MKELFNNSVLKPSVNTTKWFKSAGIRALKTFAQTAVAMITVGQSIADVSWSNIISVSFVAAVISILTSVAGIPEVPEE